jgi:hypothetical protein
MLIVMPSNGLQSLAEPRSKWRRAPQPASIVNIYSIRSEPVAYGNYRYRTFASSWVVLYRYPQAGLQIRITSVRIRIQIPLFT